MSDTPRTDAEEFTGQAEWAEDNSPLLGCVLAEFSRTLERELAEKTEEHSAMGKLVSLLQEYYKLADLPPHVFFVPGSDYCLVTTRMKVIEQEARKIVEGDISK